MDRHVTGTARSSSAIQPSPVARNRPSRLKLLFQEESLAAYAALAPSVIVTLVFVVIPIFYSLYMSFHNWSLTRGKRAFIGLENYERALSDPQFWSALLNTGYFAVGSVVGSTVLALAVAILLNRGIRGLGFFRTAFFMPEVSSTIVVALVWLWIFDPHYGLANHLLDSVGLPTSNWLTDPRWAMPALILMAVWKSVGYNMVIYLAALQGIPESMYEASSIDGAGPAQQLRFITIPLLMPATAFVVVMGTIKSFQVFGQVYVMTQGGPLGSTMVLVYYLYEQAFESFRLGYASAVAWLLALVIFALSWIQYRVLGRE